MDENEVTAAVCAHLSASGYQIVQHLSTTQKGTDIIARELSSGRLLHVEAKGATSSRAGSPRFDVGFDGTQVYDRVAKAIYACLMLRASNPDVAAHDVALAVPDTPAFRKYVGPVGAQLASAGLRVFLVGSDHDVTELAG